MTENRSKQGRSVRAARESISVLNPESEVCSKALFAGGVLTLVMTLVISSFAFIFVSGRAGAVVYYVGGPGPGNYTTIQAAVDAANPGDTVFVYSGTYPEHVVVNKSISLVGEDRDTTVIDGGGAGSTINITADWVNVTGFTVTRGAVAVDIRQVHNATISRNMISNSQTGISLGVFLEDSYNNTIADNILSGNTIGITGTYTHGPRIVNNTILLGERWGIRIHLKSDDGLIANNTINPGGIDIFETMRMVLTGNVMADNGIYIFGYQSEHWDTHTIDISNTVGGRPVYYWKHMTGGTVPSDAGQVIIASSSGVSVIGQNISHIYGGILLGFSSGNIIDNNRILDGGIGIELRHSDWNTVTGNTLIRDSTGIGLFGDPGQECGHNTVANNTALTSASVGVYLYYARHNTVLDNIVSDGGVGIYLVDSWNTTITNNSISSNDRGFTLRGWSSADISANRIADNGLGMGIEYYQTGFTSVIHHNEFISNTAQANDDSLDYWDNGYPSGGNYWSDYTGVDDFSGPGQDEPGSDDIGDTPYPIPGGSNMDRYPLMRPGGPFLPQQPRNLKAVEGDSEVMLSWIPPWSDGRSPITNYSVYRGDAPGGETYLTELGNVLDYTDIGLNNGQTYFYQVSAKNAVGEGPRSDEANATPATEPAAPTGLTAVGGDESVALNWTAPMDDGGPQITNYTVYRGSVSGGETFLVEIGDILAYTDTGLTNGQTYFYQVSAKNVAGEGPRSDEANATPTGPPFAPRNLNALPSSTQVGLTWSPPANTGGLPILHYRIFRGNASGTEAFLVEVGSIQAYTDTGLTNGRQFYYMISAVNGVGEGPSSSEVDATPGTVPSQPLDLTAVARKGRVALTWQPPADDGGFPVTGYKVYRGTTSGGEVFLASTDVVLTYVDTAVTNGITYYYWITAENPLGEGQNSPEVVGSPQDIPPACVISTPRLGSTVSGKITVSGLASDSDGSVQLVEVRIDQEDWITASGNTSWNYVWDTAEVPDGGHMIYARSYDGNSYSPETSINVTVSNQGNPTLPIAIAGLGVTGGAAALVWLFEPLRIALIGFLAFMGTKLRRDEVFENEKRDMIRGYLAANPGANYASIRADLGIANGTLVYHLNTMEKEGFIRSWHDGRFKRFALKDHPIADIQPRLTDIELIVLQTLQNDPGLTQGEIAKEVGVSQPTISYHMKKLAELGFVKVTRHGIRNHYTAVIQANTVQKEADIGGNHGGGNGGTSGAEASDGGQG